MRSEGVNLLGFQKRLSSLLLAWMIILSMVLTPLSASAEANEEADEDLSTPVTENVESDVVENSETTIEEDVDEPVEAEVEEEAPKTVIPEKKEDEATTNEKVETTPKTDGKEPVEIDELEEVTEDEGATEEISIMPMAISTPGVYTTDPNSIVVPAKIEGVSTNAHTLSEMVWANGNIVYAAIKATHGLESMTLNGVTTTDMDQYNANISIFVDGKEYVPNGLSGNTKDSHWTVFKFNLSELNLDESGLYPFSVKGIGGGHDIKGNLLFTIPKIDVEVKKVWVGGTERPEITLQLIGQVEDEPSKIIASANVDGTETPAWTHKWTQVNEYDPYGRPYTHTANEETVPTNYDKTLNGLTVTNTYNPNQLNIDVTKKWIGPSANAVTIKLFANGVDTGKTLILNEGNNWSGSFKDLNHLDDTTGQAITYTVGEVAITDYSNEKTGTVEEGFIFTNTNNTKVTVDVEKEWVGKIGSPVTVSLLANGLATGQTVTLNGDNEWKGSFPNLRKYDATTGDLIVYSIVEDDIPEGYEVTYSTGDNGQLIVTNTAKTGSLTVKKVDENGNALAGATFELQDLDGNVIGTEITSEDGQILFDELEFGDYLLVETKAPDGYRKLGRKIEVTISADNLYVVETIENTKKDWEIPSTGGNGTSIFYGIGALFMTLTLTLFLRRRKINA